MFGLLKKNAYSIGIDICNDGVRLAQLENNGRGIALIAGVTEKPPEDIEPGSSTWQRWAIDSIHNLISKNGFQGKEVTAGIPMADVFIDHIKMPKTDEKKIEDTVFSKIKQKLPFKPVQENTMIKYIPTENDHIMVLATDRTIIDRHLAIYEKAGVSIKSIGVWPMALVSCYTTFFGRRQSDLKAIVMLISIEENSTNVVICRHRNLLFARSIPIGAQRFEDEKAITTLVFELTACKRQFASMHKNTPIERIIFLSSRVSDRNACASIAKQLEMPAQIGDCLAAVKISDSLHFKRDSECDNENPENSIDRRNCQVNWAIAFGMSLS